MPNGPPVAANKLAWGKLRAESSESTRNTLLKHWIARPELGENLPRQKAQKSRVPLALSHLDVVRTTWMIDGQSLGRYC